MRYLSPIEEAIAAMVLFAVGFAGSYYLTGAIFSLL